MALTKVIRVNYNNPTVATSQGFTYSSSLLGFPALSPNPSLISNVYSGVPSVVYTVPSGKIAKVAMLPGHEKRFFIQPAFSATYSRIAGSATFLFPFSATFNFTIAAGSVQNLLDANFTFSQAALSAVSVSSGTNISSSVPHNGYVALSSFRDSLAAAAVNDNALTGFLTGAPAGVATPVVHFDVLGTISAAPVASKFIQTGFVILSAGDTVIASETQSLYYGYAGAPLGSGIVSLSFGLSINATNAGGFSLYVIEEDAS